jgi:hypothetical protein
MWVVPVAQHEPVQTGHAAEDPAAGPVRVSGTSRIAVVPWGCGG